MAPSPTAHEQPMAPQQPLRVESVACPPTPTCAIVAAHAPGNNCHLGRDITPCPSTEAPVRDPTPDSKPDSAAPPTRSRALFDGLGRGGRAGNGASRRQSVCGATQQAKPAFLMSSSYSPLAAPPSWATTRTRATSASPARYGAPPGPSAQHWLGSDTLFRDLLARPPLAPAFWPSPLSARSLLIGTVVGGFQVLRGALAGPPDQPRCPTWRSPFLTCFSSPPSVSR